MVDSRLFYVFVPILAYFVFFANDLYAPLSQIPGYTTGKPQLNAVQQQKLASQQSQGSYLAEASQERNPILTHG